MKIREFFKKKSFRLNSAKKFFLGLFLLITFPIRNPVIFVPILMFAYLAPTFMGAKPTEVHLWYWNKIKVHSQHIGSTISEKTQAIIPDVNNFKIPLPDLGTVISKDSDNSQGLDMVDIQVPDTQNIRRQTFEKSKEVPSSIDALKKAQLQEAKIQETEDVENKIPNKISKHKLPLIFVSEEEQIIGRGEVINANEIKINDKNYFLYGIYVDPKSTKGQEAKRYLTSIIDNNVIVCTLKAYTYQNVGTVICTINGENINWMLVNNGFSRNVALEK